MKQYLELCKFVLENGETKIDRTGTGTISYFGLQTRYDLRDGFPIITTKKMHLKSIIYELLWFIKGDTNIQYLVKNNVRIWNEWPYKKFKNSKSYNDETIEQFVNKIINDDEFAKLHGNLGPVYGKQWRDFAGYDQLSELIKDIKNSPQSRRLILSAWNPPEIEKMMLPPCHAFIQFYVSENKYLSCQLYQRSADLFLGVPFNVSSYSLLLVMIAKVTNLIPKEFIHTIGDGHIYLNHVDQVKLQISRKPKKLPLMKVNSKNNIEDFVFEDFELVGYECDAHIPGKVSV